MAEELKTLEDLQVLPEKIIAINPEDKQEFINSNRGNLVRVKDLRDLAIKWIKEEIFLKINRDEQDMFKIENLYNSIVHSDKTINRWMKRLNISEEDLK